MKNLAAEGVSFDKITEFIMAHEMGHVIASDQRVLDGHANSGLMMPNLEGFMDNELGLLGPLMERAIRERDKMPEFFQ